MSFPLITVGIITYNASETVNKAIQSALSQSWRSIEIIIIDDCSTDDTFKKINSFAINNRKISVFRNNNNYGVGFSRNRVIKEAKGEFVVFFDDDDESLKNRVSEQYNRIKDYENKFANGAPVICYTARKIIYQNGKMRIEKTMGQILDKLGPNGPAVARRVLHGEPLMDAYGSCPTCSQMARLNTYKLVGGFDPLFRRGEDTDFNIRLAIAGGHFVGISEPLVIQNMTLTSDKSLHQEYKYMKMLLYKHRDFIKQKVNFKFIIYWLDFKQAWLEARYFVFFNLFIKLLFSYPITTIRRLIFSIPNYGLNRAFSRFYKNEAG